MKYWRTHARFNSVNSLSVVQWLWPFLILVEHFEEGSAEDGERVNKRHAMTHYPVVRPRAPQQTAPYPPPDHVCLCEMSLGR